MLQSKDLEINIAALYNSAVKVRVVFHYDAGNIDKWAPDWDEQQDFPQIELIDIFEIDEHIYEVSAGKSVYELLSDEEEDYVKDVLFAMKEDEECF